MVIPEIDLQTYSVMADFGNPDIYKICTSCNTQKILSHDNFSFHSRDKRFDSTCVDCRRKQSRDNYHNYRKLGLKKDRRPQKIEEGTLLFKCTRSGCEAPWKPATSKYFQIRKDRNGALQSICRACLRMMRSEWGKANRDQANRNRLKSHYKNKEKNNACSREYHKRFPRAHFSGLERRARIKQKYKMSIEEYDDILKSQGNSCAICGQDKERNGRKLAIDHDHISLKNRGILCSDDNRGIGLFGENIERMARAIEYLKNSKTSYKYDRNKIKKGLYDFIAVDQGGLCAICGQAQKPYSAFGKNMDKLFIDHDHEDGFIRGALCRPCNSGLARFRDNIDRIKKAIEYLVFWKRDQ